MSIPQPAVGLLWVLTVVALSVTIWAYSGVVIGLSFIGGAIVMSFLWIIRERPAMMKDGNNAKRGLVILIMTSIAVGVWMIAAPAFGLFFGATAIFGYLVGLVCSKYSGGG